MAASNGPLASGLTPGALDLLNELQITDAVISRFLSFPLQARSSILENYLDKLTIMVTKLPSEELTSVWIERLANLVQTYAIVIDNYMTQRATAEEDTSELKESEMKEPELKAEAEADSNNDNFSVLTMQIFVNLPTGKKFTLEVTPTDTIWDVKDQISGKKGIPIDDIVLYCRKVQLGARGDGPEDQYALRDYYISNEDTIDLVVESSYFSSH